jgi:hypothetical protein
MHTIYIDKECGCFKRSPFKNAMTFDSKDDALMQANIMQNHMNQKFCRKHQFTAIEEGEHFRIRVEMRPSPDKETAQCCNTTGDSPL